MKLSQFFTRASSSGAGESGAKWTDFLEDLEERAYGSTISPRQARRLPTVLAASRAIAGAVSSLPVNVYEGPEGDQEEITGPLQGLVAKSPRPGWTAKTYWHWCVRTMLLHTRGRAVSVILRGGAGRAVGLQPLAPSSVWVDLVERNGWLDLRYRYSGKGGSKTYWSEDVLDFTLELDFDMKRAVSPLLEMLPHLSLVQDIANYSKGAFTDMPPIVLQGRSDLKNPTGSKAAITAAVAINKLLKRGDSRVLPIPDNLEAKALGITGEQLQSAQIKRLLSEESAMGLGVSPAFLGDMSKSSYRSAEAAALHFAKFVAMPITSALAQEVNLKLLSPSGRIMRFDFDEFLRGDLKALADALSILRMAGLVTANEGRRKLGMSRSKQEGSDELVMQSAMTSLDNIANTETGEDDGDDEDNDPGGNAGNPDLPGED